MSASLCLLALAPIVADGDEPKPEARLPWVDLLAASRSGEVGADAQGTGDGRMTIRVANRTDRRLRVVVPPGLIAAGATGQFGGIGGLGGLGGGIGLGGFGGIGGLGGGFGGQVGGVGFGGGAPRQMTLSPQVGLSMLGQSIMTSTGHPDSWNTTSMAQGMPLGMGAFGVGPGPGLVANQLGGFGGGFRSVPPTDLPAVVLEPGQVRPLMTRLVSLKAPGPGSGLAPPAPGEALRLGDIAELGASPRVQDVLRRLAREKAPEAVAQLALWNAAGMPWDEIARASRGWANGPEIALARSLVDRIDRRAGGDPGRLMVEVTPGDAGSKALADEIRAALRDRSMLGLAVVLGMPARPDGPAVGCVIRANGTSAEPELVAELAASDDRGEAWTPIAKFPVPAARDASGRLDGPAFGDALAEGLLGRLVVATLKTGRGSKPKGKETYAIRVENHSPLILNGITLAGMQAGPDEAPKSLVGIGISPRRSFSLPASAEAVERLGLKRGIRVAAIDLSGP